MTVSLHFISYKHARCNAYTLYMDNDRGWKQNITTAFCGGCSFRLNVQWLQFVVLFFILEKTIHNHIYRPIHNISEVVLNRPTFNTEKECDQIWRHVVGLLLFVCLGFGVGFFKQQQRTNRNKSYQVNVGVIYLEKVSAHSSSVRSIEEFNIL